MKYVNKASSSQSEHSSKNPKPETLHFLGKKTKKITKEKKLQKKKQDEVLEHLNEQQIVTFFKKHTDKFLNKQSQDHRKRLNLN